MRYGIQPVYSRPGHPEDNGRHERMHRTLLERTALRPAADFIGQQQLFDEFRQMFNEERPHEAIGQDRPADHHRPSNIPFPDKEPTPVYAGHFEVERVDRWGRIRWGGGKQIDFSEAFADQTIAFEPIDYRRWNVHFASFVVATFDATARLFR
jgi:hypothetical protein